MLDYKNLKEVIVTNQEEMDAIPFDYKGSIIIRSTCTIVVTKKYHCRVEVVGNSSVAAWGNSSVVARENSFVVARESSSVVAGEHSSVEAWEHSSVTAKGNSSVVAWGNSSVVARESSSVVVKSNSSVVAKENSLVEAWGCSSVEALGNSSVVAWGNSSVVAWDHSSVVAREDSSVVAWEHSSVEAREHSSIRARANSSIVAGDNSSVEAWGNSSVVASGNSQIVNNLTTGNVKINGNAREVFMPKTIHEFMEFYGINHTDTRAIFYKAVRKNGGVYYSDYNHAFIYTIGEYKTDNCDTDINEDCSYGISISHLNWALNFGRTWHNLAILEVETDISDIVMPKNSCGKVRTSKIKVIREVPLEECGTYGKLIARRIANMKEDTNE